MLRLAISFILFFQGLTGFIPSSSARAQILPVADSSELLCLPGVYLVDPQDCSPLGASGYITQIASQGMYLPLVSLPAHPIDGSLGELSFSYALLGDGPTKVYASLQDAVHGVNSIRTIEAGNLRYVSYIDYEDTEAGRFFLLYDDTWVQVSTRVSVPHSYPGGINFSRPPLNQFGWVLPFAPTIETKSTPGYQSEDYTGQPISQYQLVQIYASKMVNNEEWDLITPDQWVDGRYLGKVNPTPTPPPGVENGRWIEVNLFEQTLAVYDQGKLVFATLIATGLDPFFTKPGLFQIQKKLDSTLMSGSFAEDRADFYYLEDVPWTMYYDHARALHGAYWRTAFGYPQSHGCINLSPADSHWLYDWANVGDWVYVWDPSGNTPTDPSYYGEGGA
jgi:hypothetical protein